MRRASRYILTSSQKRVEARQAQLDAETARDIANQAMFDYYAKALKAGGEATLG